MSHDTHIQQAIQTLEADGRFRILEKLALHSHYAELPSSKLRRGVVLDVETTGLDWRQDRIIEIALLPFDYSPASAQIAQVHPAISYLEDPGRAIPAEITELTGISNEMVKGQRIDEANVLACLNNADLIIAHNAGFDRPFVQTRFPGLTAKPWACSQQEIPWRQAGCSGRSLDYLLFKLCDRFFDGHRAESDCRALVHLLATAWPDGRQPLSMLLASARQISAQIWAIGAPFDAKDLLKARNYRWNPGNDGRPKAWYCKVPQEQHVAELDWLRAEVYQGQDGPWQIESISARERYLKAALD